MRYMRLQLGVRVRLPSSYGIAWLILKRRGNALRPGAINFPIHARTEGGNHCATTTRSSGQFRPCKANCTTPRNMAHDHNIQRHVQSRKARKRQTTHQSSLDRYSTRVSGVSDFRLGYNEGVQANLPQDNQTEGNIHHGNKDKNQIPQKGN